MDHADLRRLAAGAVMEDLDRDEAAELAAHVSRCAECRTLGDELVATAGDLALAARQRRPPPSLRGSVIAAVRAADRPLPGQRTGASLAWSWRVAPGPARPTADDTAAALDGRPAVDRRLARFRRLSFATTALAACLVVTVVALGVEARGLGEQLSDARASVGEATREAATQAAAMAVAVDPRHVSATLHAEPLAPSAAATVVYRPGSPDAYLVVGDLPATPPGHVYQLWIADAAGAHALGTFSSDGSRPVVVPFAMDLAGKTAAMVTLEPAGGATGAPGPQAVFGELGAGS